MNLPTRLATRYIFGKKSTNVINIISAIAVFGIAVGTAALILVLSVFNGFEDLITNLFQKFNPDLKITPVTGKTFPEDTLVIRKIRKMPGVVAVSTSLEELALFEYKNSQTFGTLKGVDDQYNRVTAIESAIVEGDYRVERSDPPDLVMGAGIAQRLAIDVEDDLSSLSVYTPKRKKTSPLEAPFTSRHIRPSGVFAIQQEFDQEYTIASLDFAREFFDYENELSAIEIKMDSTKNLNALERSIIELLGSKFKVKDRYHQDEAFMKLMNIEKWMSYAIVCLTLLLVSFNMVGALWMIVLDKRRDIAILKSLGMRADTIRSVFLHSGMILSSLGLVGGIVLALVLYTLQKTVGLVSIPEGFVVNTYPIALRLQDFIIVGITVIMIGAFASLPAAQKARTIETTFNE